MIFGPAITIIDREAYDPGMHAGAGLCWVPDR